MPSGSFKMYFFQVRVPVLVLGPASALVFGVLLSQAVMSHTLSSSGFVHQHFSNGVVQLIIEAYMEEMLKEMDSNPEFQLNENQSALLRHKMKELYTHIRQHPALHQRHLWVGKERPDYDPDVPYTDHFIKQSRGSSKKKRNLSDDSPNVGRVLSSQTSSEKRSRTMSSFPAEEICKTNRQWEQVNITNDIDNKEVEVIQDTVQQYVFSYRCAAETGPCIGISPLYDSECTERYGWMYMYYRKLDDPDRIPHWGFVAVPHHCACKITPKYIPDS